MSHILNDLCTLRRDMINPNKEQLSSCDGIVEVNRWSLDGRISVACASEDTPSTPAIPTIAIGKKRNTNCYIKCNPGTGI